MHHLKIVSKKSDQGFYRHDVLDQVGNNFIFPSIGTNQIIQFITFNTVNIGRSDDSNKQLNKHIEGHRNIEIAAQTLKEKYEQDKKSTERWKNFWAAVEVASVLLSVVPIAGQFMLAARVANTALKLAKYTFYTLEAALAIDAFAHGSTQLIMGEGVSLGRDLFKRIGKYTDPVIQSTESNSENKST